MVDRNDIRNGASACVAPTKDSAASTTIANSDDDLRIRNSVECPLECFFHVHRYRAGHKKQISVSRTCHKLYANSFDVVIRVVERLYLEFAAVAGAGVDVADAESTAQDLSEVLLKAS